VVTWMLGAEDFERVFTEQNPWLRDGEVPSALAHPVERPLAEVLWKRLVNDEPRRFQLILGPRRVGKTTVLYQTVRRLLGAGVEPGRIWWLRLDHPLLIQADLGALVRAVFDSCDATAERPVYLMLDELVYAEHWDLWLKTFYDERWPVRIAATSSATATLRDRRTESGVGRWEEQHLAPYLLPEFLDLIGGGERNVAAGETLADTLAGLPAGRRAGDDLRTARLLLTMVGGFPELLASAVGADLDGTTLQNLIFKSQRALRGDAVERAVYKDIPQLFRIANPMELERLLYVLAGQFTGILSPSGVCGELGMSQPTFDRYLSYLERAFLVFTLTNYSGREANVQKRGRKLYFLDGAVRNAALHRGLAPLDDPAELGMLLENLVAASLRSLAVLSGGRLHHWRDGSREVDLILDHPTEPLAFEIASSPSHSRAGLQALIERHPRFEGRAYLAAPQSPVVHPQSSSSGTGSLPLDDLLLAVGAQAHQALIDRVGVRP